jgi:hypothetical protein
MDHARVWHNYTDRLVLYAPNPSPQVPVYSCPRHRNMEHCLRWTQKDSNSSDVPVTQSLSHSIIQSRVTEHKNRQQHVVQPHESWDLQSSR